MASTSFTDGVTLIPASWLNDIDTGVYAYLTAVAGTNTITATGPISQTAYTTGQRFRFIPAATNTGATTLNISNLGAKNIFLRGAALVGSEIYKNQPIEVMYDGTQFNIVGNSAFPSIPRMHISGLTYANNAGDATNDIDIAAGECVDSTNVRLLQLSAITKQSDAAWAVGTNAGGLDTGAVGNSDYYTWLITRVDTGVVDVLFSLSSTAPTMPANYTLKRLIGWFKRVGGTIVAFHTYETEGGGLELTWDVPTLDINLANTLTTARRTDAAKVPLNFSTIAILNVHIDDAAGTVANICCPDQTDAAPSTSAAPLSVINAAAAVNGAAQLFIRTSAAGLIAARATVATIDLYAVATVGFRWARRN